MVCNFKRQAEFSENLPIEPLYIEVRLGSRHELEAQSFCGGK